MASISTSKKTGVRSCQFSDATGTRRTIGLGKMPKKQAESFRLRIETLVSCKLSGTPIDPELAIWVSERSDALKEKLRKYGLTNAPGTVSLSDAMDTVITGRKDVKEATKVVWRQGKRSLEEHFGADKPIADITRANAEDFKQALIGAGLGNGTIRKRLQTASMVFNQMVSREAIEKNPFSGISVPATVDQSRNVFVPRKHVFRAMEQAPDAEWRLIIGLSRFAGLRCPSEVLSLKWDNILWDREEIVVISPKTERHPDGDQRTIPIFADIREPLLEASEQAEDGAVYVIEKHRSQAEGPGGWKNSNFRSALHKMIRRAGLKPWPKPFHAMRASFETELVEMVPVQTAAAWLGNSPKIAMKHYLRVMPEHAEKARNTSFGGYVKSYAESYVNATQNPTQRATAMFCGQPQEMTQAPILQGPTQCIATNRTSVQNAIAEGTGLEPAAPYGVPHFQ
jgi:integrase